MHAHGQMSSRGETDKNGVAHVVLFRNPKTRKEGINLPHTICHLEIPTTDLKRAGEFYKKLFGWKIDYGWGADYATFDTGEGVLTGGGLDRRDKITPGNIVIYISVDDISTMLEKAVELGAKKVMEKREIPNVGWFGLFTDLDGNTLGLFTAKE